MIDALFGSKTRVKLLRLFMGHPDQSFYVREITRTIGEQINSVRRELSNMIDVGVIGSESVENKLYYQANQSYKYYGALRAIFADVPERENNSSSDKSPADATSMIAVVPEEAEFGLYRRLLQSVPGVSSVLIAGSLLHGSMSQIDLLIIGSAAGTRLQAAIKAIERREGHEINYSVMSVDDYYYRLSVRDRFLSDIIDSKHIVIIDKDGITKL